MTNRRVADLVDAYDKARKFLIGKIPSENADAVLEHYLSLPDKSQSPVSLEELYRGLLVSAQNANMKARVIGGSIGGVEKLAAVLFDFDPKKVFDD